MGKTKGFVSVPKSGFSKERLLLYKKELTRMPEGSLNIKHYKCHFYFYHYIGSRQIYINGNKTLVYKLARKKYLQSIIQKRNPFDFLDKCVAAGLSIQRITLSAAQYKWVNSDYPANTGWQSDLKYDTPSKVSMRSKSERDIGTRFEYHAVPYRYEMLIKVNVSSIVQGLREYLSNDPGWRYNPRTLYSYRNGKCFWNVPEELQWMNAPGSIWRSFDQRTQTITLSVDFAILLGDGSILIWEHTGLCLNPVYRNNASERIFILQASGHSDKDKIIYTMESDIWDLNNIDRIIEEEILPRL